MRPQDCDFSYWQQSVNVARVHRDCSAHVSPCWTVFSWIFHISYCQCVPQSCIEFVILNGLHLDHCSFSHLCYSNIFLVLHLPCAWSDYTAFHFWSLIWLGDLLWQMKGQQKCLVYFPEGTLRTLYWVAMVPFSCLWIKDAWSARHPETLSFRNEEVKQNPKLTLKEMFEKEKNSRLFFNPLRLWVCLLQ